MLALAISSMSKSHSVKLLGSFKVGMHFTRLQKRYNFIINIEYLFRYVTFRVSKHSFLIDSE